MKPKCFFTKEDFYETEIIAGLIDRIDKIDAEYVNVISDEIFKQQPFVLTVLLGYKPDVTETELEELMKIFFLIWEYFKAKNKLPAKKITQESFEKIQKKNIQMLKYSEGEQNQAAKMEVYSCDLQNLKSNSLMTAIFYRFQNYPVLVKMDKEKKGIILIGVKSFIESFETIK